MSETKWVTVATAPDQLTAEMWRAMLAMAEIPAVVEDAPSYLGVSALPCRVVVPAPLLGKAKEVIGRR